ncbi:MAG: multiheme c-type cytochrome [Rhodopirellula sp. JB044]|uniref:multiheme c-type cytochrome n=1 Tax=Rhodopirellula sp. JB044 TaxID=3342844 RepID=UPI00370BF746
MRFNFLENMRRTRVWVCAASLLACGFAGGELSAQSVSVVGGLENPLGLGSRNAPLLRSDLRVNGAQSCASAGCHGGPRPGVVQTQVSRSNEYPIWLENDPHSQSWRTFCSDESVAMMRRLNILSGSGEVIDQAGYDNCLACHNTTRRFTQPTHAAGRDRFETFHSAKKNSFQREGVGCEACHGPSQQWIGVHFQTGWDAGYASENGFVNADNLLTRARMCATCHVGDQDRDMNHDLIAAGHPPLRYEFATYHARQPKHWRDTEADAEWRYEAQLWLAGQIAAMDASLALMIERSQSGPHGAGPAGSRWPELSVYDCAACHHDLGFENQRRPDLPPGRAPGVALVSSWNDIGMRWLLMYRMRGSKAIDVDYQLLGAIEDLRMTLHTDEITDADLVARMAAQVRTLLSQWVDQVYSVERFEFEASELAQLVTQAAGDQETYRTWESASQYYLAAVAARNAWPQGASGPAFFVANRLRLGLRYADRIQTPRFAEASSDRGRQSPPLLAREEAAKLAVELAAWLGPVDLPDLSAWTEDSEKTDRMREDLRAVIDRINDQIGKRNAERGTGAGIEGTEEKGPRDGDVETPKPNQPEQRDENAAPKPRVKTREELLEELRRRRANQANPFSDD